MLGKERQDEIINYLKIYETVSVKKLTQLLYASEATVRRDLNELEKNGLVRRVFGGASLVIKDNTQIPLFVRENQNAAAKIEICRQASELIRDSDVIFLDASSTAQCMVRFLSRFQNLTVVTNGLKIAGLLHDNHIRTFCTGGSLIQNSYAFAGKKAERFLEDIRTDICFLSCLGMSQDGLFTDASESETYLRQVALQGARTRVMLMIDSKFGKTYMHKVCHSRDVDHIFTDGALPEGIVLREPK